ncbi:thioredoxin [Patescibacteria group bacterium]|nr:thioredoxin [Patescibacteria group bacterium]MBU1890076.1 thioredoxin [Patescibacteria group bacterium]
MAEVILTDQNFEQEVLKEESLPVLVDFWATWCGPCKALAPIIEELANENNGKVKVGKLEVDQNPITAGQFSVMSIPTIGIFVKGEMKKQMVGLQSKDKITSELKEFVK